MIRHTHTETYRHRHTDTNTHRHVDTHIQTYRHTQTHTDTHTEVQRLCAECGCLTINLLIKTTAKDGGHAPDPVMLVHSAV